MSAITVKEGAKLYYKDWGKGPVVTFSHGWPLSADAWDGQMLFLAQNGFRVVAHDRRGHGRSSQPSFGNDMDGFADDLAAVIEALDLTDATLVGHSTGGGEVARYIGRHGNKRVARAVLISAVPPLMLKTAANPEGRQDNLLSGRLARTNSHASGSGECRPARLPEYTDFAAPLTFAGRTIAHRFHYLRVNRKVVV
jgi:non-heme chloroperoxidase